MNENVSEEKNDLVLLCSTIRDLCKKKDYGSCEKIIVDSMRLYPHSPEPHNLIGIVLEKGNHSAAMKHFRAAWALDPTYIPARHNLELFGSFYSSWKCAFDENDCADDNLK